jgi:hypothetical protein
MEGEADSFPFVLALDLGRTLAELDDMPWPEYLAWQAFYKYRAAMAELDRQES